MAEHMLLGLAAYVHKPVATSTEVQLLCLLLLFTTEPLAVEAHQ